MSSDELHNIVQAFVATPRRKHLNKNSYPYAETNKSCKSLKKNHIYASTFFKALNGLSRSKINKISIFLPTVGQAHKYLMSINHKWGGNTNLKN